MLKNKNTSKRPHELNRFRDTLVHTACLLMPREDSVIIQPQLILEMRFLTPFKTLVTWHKPHPDAHPPVPDKADTHFYEVRMAGNFLTYHFHRFKLGNGLYLRRLWDTASLPATQAFHQCEYFLEPVR